MVVLTEKLQLSYLIQTGRLSLKVGWLVLCPIGCFNMYMYTYIIIACYTKQHIVATVLTLPLKVRTLVLTSSLYVEIDFGALIILHAASTKIANPSDLCTDGIEND